MQSCPLVVKNETITPINGPYKPRNGTLLKGGTWMPGLASG